MNSKFKERLEEYLNSECSDYDLSYNWEWVEDCQFCEVEVKRNGTPYVKSLYFRYNEKENDLTIELSEDSYYVTREFDESVKYFWMLVSPALFPN